MCGSAGIPAFLHTMCAFDGRRPAGWGALTATLSLGMLVSVGPSYALGALGPFLTDDLGLSRAALGSLTTVLYVVGAGLSPVAGPMVDHFGARRLLLALFAIGALAAAAASAARSYVPLAGAIALAGLPVALGNPVTNSLIAVHVDAQRQGVTVGLKQSGVQIGAFLSGALLPGLATALGWRGAVLASGILGVVGVAAALVAVPSRPAMPRSPTAYPVGGPLPREVAWLSVYALLMGFGVGAVGVYLPLYAVEGLGLSPAVGGFAAALAGLVGIVARVLWGRGQDRTAMRVPVALTWLAAGSVAAAGLVWAAAAIGSWALWAGVVVLGASAVAWNAVGMVAVVRDVAPGTSGRASGRVLLGFYGGTVASPAFGWTVDRTGSYGLGWALVAATFVAAALLAARWSAAQVSPPAPATRRP